MIKEWTNERVRELADLEFVKPAKASHTIVRIEQGDLYDRARRLGLPQSHANRIGTALESPKFWQPRGLEMLTPRGQSRARTTVYEYRFCDQQGDIDNELTPNVASETPAQRAFRLTEKLRGLMKDEIAAHGGTEGFMRWVRSDECEEAV